MRLKYDVSSFAWSELNFQGRLDVFRWINDIGNNLLSYREAENEAKLQKGVNAVRVYYPLAIDRNAFQVNFNKDHLLTHQNQQLINSRQLNAEGSAIRFLDGDIALINI